MADGPDSANAAPARRAETSELIKLKELMESVPPPSMAAQGTHSQLNLYNGTTSPELRKLSTLARVLDDNIEISPPDYERLLAQFDKHLTASIEVWETRAVRAMNLSARQKIFDKIVLAGLVAFATLTMSPESLGLYSQATAKIVAAVVSVTSLIGAVVVAIDPFSGHRSYGQRLEQMIAVGRGFKLQLLLRPTVRELKSISHLLFFAHDILRPHREGE
jgi:hypothetical protein